MVFMTLLINKKLKLKNHQSDKISLIIMLELKKEPLIYLRVFKVFHMNSKNESSFTLYKFIAENPYLLIL